MEPLPEQQVLKRLQVENPWWEGAGAFPGPYRDWRPRPYLDLVFPLISQLDPRRAVILLGPRQVGKTVLLHHTIQRLIADGIPPRRLGYISIDKPAYAGLALEQLLALYEKAAEVDPTTEPTYLFFDEIQYLRDWEVHLKALVDGHPYLKITASGSAAAALRLKSSESGAGRFTDFLLPPLTFHEYLVLLREHHLVEEIETQESEQEPVSIDYRVADLEALNHHFLQYLNLGGYPEALFSENIQRDPGRFIKADILDKVLLRDLPSLYGIQDVQELNYLFTTLAFNTAGEVSVEELSKRSGVAKNTIRRYLEYLEAAFLIKVVHRIDRDARRFQRANFFKVYLTNPSNRSALFSPIEGDDESFGAVVETAIFSQWFHSGKALHYARWKGGEVDLVALDPRQRVAWAVEAKASDRFVDRLQELRALIEFCHANNLRRVLVTTRTRRERRLYKNVELEFMPASLYCFLVGYHTVLARQLDSERAARGGKVFIRGGLPWEVPMGS